MSVSMLTSRAVHVEQQFDSEKSNFLRNFLEHEKATSVESKGLAPSNYEVFAVRRNANAGVEIFGPKKFAIGTYTEEALYGASTSPLPAFFSAVRTLQTKAEGIRTIEENEIEFAYQVTLFWAEVNKLSQFLGVSASVSEIVSELLTARAQFVKRDTPPGAIAAIADALRILSEAKRLNSLIVEKITDTLETGGIDPLAVDALRREYA